MGPNLCHSTILILGLFGLVATTLAQSDRPECSNALFQELSIDGAEILGIKAQERTNVTVDLLAGENQYAKNVTGLDICEVTVTYTHPGYNNTVNTVVWLPRPENWSGRFIGVGGGGWVAGMPESLPAWASEGFAAVITDGGQSQDIAANVKDWVLSSDGNINWDILQVFTYIALDDAATLGKSITRTYYGKPHTYSYWSGCSQGGRQGHMMSQRFPEQYNGILTAAPAINWAEFIPQMFWPVAVMNELDQYPTQCELDAAVQAVLKACDSLDGLEDGIILSPDVCDFDLMGAVGQSYNCTKTGETTIISEPAAKVVAETYKGPNFNGKFLWYGIEPGTPVEFIANTTCSNGTCIGVPNMFGRDWFQIFIQEDPNFDLATVNLTVFDRFFRQSIDRYTSILGTSNPDLTDFHNAGGKLLNWHGLADQTIPPNGSVNYFERVLERDPQANDYFRIFQAPGVNHCQGGLGWFPGNAMQSLIAWVENGTAPETLEAKTVGASEVRTANLCLWPRRLVYVEGDPKEPTSFECQ